MTRLSLSGALALALFATGCSSTTVTMVDDMPDPTPTPGDMAMVSECVDGAATAEGSTFECSNVDLVAYVPLEAFDADQLNDMLREQQDLVNQYTKSRQPGAAAAAPQGRP